MISHCICNYNNVSLSNPYTYETNYASFKDVYGWPK